MTTVATENVSVTSHREGAGTRTDTALWILSAVLFASTSVVVGVIWDISWHRTIGRDTFFTPAHLAIYLGGTVAGLSCGWLVLRTTFSGTTDEKARGVRFWGFTGPLGAWICIWGAIAMITSGPFDDWWHNAYGLDVEILSPPHTVLALGIITIQLGALMMALARQNNAHERHPVLKWMFVYGAGLVVLMLAVMATDYIGFANQTRNPSFYIASALLFPLFLVAVARASKLRWGATAAAAAYMGVTVLMIWILQLFPAQPLLGPIYNPVERMVPPGFPLLLISPALAIDLLASRPSADTTRGRRWLTALAMGGTFLGVLLVVQWLFAEFLLSPYARNFLFGADQWDYNARLGDWRYEYWGAATAPMLGRGLAIALLISTLMARLGLAWGDWLARVRR
jgi:hypothetical protein